MDSSLSPHKKPHLLLFQLSAVTKVVNLEFVDMFCQFSSSCFPLVNISIHLEPCSVPLIVMNQHVLAGYDIQLTWHFIYLFILLYRTSQDKYNYKKLKGKDKKHRSIQTERPVPQRLDREAGVFTIFNQDIYVYLSFTVIFLLLGIFI